MHGTFAHLDNVIHLCGIHFRQMIINTLEVGKVDKT